MGIETRTTIAAQGLRSVREQAPEIDLAVDVVESQFNELSTLLDQVTMLGNHMPVTTSTDTDADHKKPEMI